MLVWDEPAVEQLRQLHAQGLSAGKIAKEFGTTRNTIAGKAYRLGIFFNTNSKPRKPRARARSSNDFCRLSNGFPRVRPLPPISGDPDQMVRCTLMELGPLSCRFPLGERAPYSFCGNKTDDSLLPYCSHHMRIVYKRTEPLDDTNCS
jgi:hypothetical protein